jgi:hypothetical protein
MACVLQACAVWDTSHSLHHTTRVLRAQVSPNVDVAGSEKEGNARLESLERYVIVEQLATENLCPQELATLQQMHKAAASGDLASAGQLPGTLEQYVTPNSPLWHLVRLKFTFTGSSALHRVGLSSPASSVVEGIPTNFRRRLGISSGGPFGYLAGAMLPALHVGPVRRVCA